MYTSKYAVNFRGVFYDLYLCTETFRQRPLIFSSTIVKNALGSRFLATKKTYNILFFQKKITNRRTNLPCL